MTSVALRAVLLALVALPLAAAPAAADNCGSYGTLPDGDGRLWERGGGGGLSTAANNSLAVLGTPTYDRGATRRWDDVDPGFPEGCTQPTGTEVAYPARLDVLSGVEVSQLSHVSAAPDPFVRHLTILRNPGLTPRTIDLWSYFQFDLSPTDVTATSSGDAQATAADHWLVAGATGNPYSAIVWQAADAQRRDSVEHVVDFAPQSPPAAAFKDGDDIGLLHFNVILAPGESKAYMLLGAVRATAAAAQAEAQQLVAGPAPVFAGIESAQLAAIQNWVVPDADGDGVPNEDDGCPYLADAAQPDADGDGQNDGCDADDDGDTLTDEQEAAFGTSPTKADTDGDGARDDADDCPKTAGTAGGCPAQDAAPPGGTTTVTTTVPGPPPPPVVVQAPADRTAPAGRFTGGAARMKLSAFRRGVPCTVTANEPVALACRLLVKPRAARLAAAGDLELASGSAAIGAGARTVRLRPSSRLLRGAKRLRVTVEAVLTDAGGNRATLRRTLRVG